MKTPNYVFDDELYHHGILGQRWGHRRFQNEDGSWTAAGRERYSEGERERFAAKDAYKTQKYKAKLESRAIKDAARRAANEERYRVRQAAKTERAARKEALKNDKTLMKEQSKADREQSKLNNKLVREQAKEKDTSTFKNALNRTKKYTMSDSELENAINRLKLEVEYNKQYALASKPNGALARADRFFDGPTGKMVRDIAVATIPKVAETATSKLLESKLKYANKEDREKIAADTEKVRAEARSFNEKAEYQKAQTEHERSKIANEQAESQSNIKLARAKEAREAWGARAANALAKAADARAETKAAQDLKIARSEAASKLMKDREDIKKAAIANEVERRTQFGYEAGNKPVNWVNGKIATDAEKRRNEVDAAQAKAQAETSQIKAKAEIDYANARSIDADTKAKAEQAQMALRNANDAKEELKIFNETVGRLANTGQISVKEAISSYKFSDSISTTFKFVEKEAKTTETPIDSKKVIDTTTSLSSLLRDRSGSGVSNDEASRFKSLKAAGKTIEEIARLTGRSTSTIAKYL